MIARCENPKSDSFALYGAKGITVCERWHTFNNFVNDMGRRPRGMTIERIDNSKGYTPDNCQWAPPSVQARNRSMTVWITHRGETLCMKDWATKLRIPYKTLHMRLQNGWSTERALTQPVRHW